MNKYEEIIKNLSEGLNGLNDELKKYENHRWISNIEREPTEQGFYDVIMSDGKRYKCYYGIYGFVGEWEPSRDTKLRCEIAGVKCKVVAWHPNPEDPSVEDIKRFLEENKVSKLHKE